MKIISKSVEETIAVAREFSKKLKKGDIVVLIGDLGAGKTHFVKGVALGLGEKGLVTSPTFTIHNVYDGGKIVINHFDMYRLSSAEEAMALGFEEYFDKKNNNGISIVEWPQNVEGLFAKEDYCIEITKLDEDKREISIRRKR